MNRLLFAVFLALAWPRPTATPTPEHDGVWLSRQAGYPIHVEAASYHVGADSVLATFAVENKTNLHLRIRAECSPGPTVNAPDMLAPYTTAHVVCQMPGDGAWWQSGLRVEAIPATIAGKGG